MRYLFAFVITILCIITCTEISAQADINMSTHWYNRGGYNPAFIARTNYLYIFANARQQWVGVEGAPKVLNVHVSEYIHKLRSAIGFSCAMDKIGASQTINPMLTYAYRITSDRNWSFSMGLSGGVYSRSVNGALFEADIINDPSIQYSTEKVISPDANAGLEFQNSNFIFGLSSTHLLSVGKQDNSYLNTNHRYSYLIYKNNNSEAFYYKLGLQVVNRNNLTVIEGNVFFRLKHSTGLMQGSREIFDFGVTVRSSRHMSFIIGINTSQDLRLGYAYGQSFIPGYYTNSSHELMVEYRIRKKSALTQYKCGGHQRP